MIWNLIILIVFACIPVHYPREGLSSRKSVPIETSVPLIQIEGAASLAQNQRLILRCKISNSGSEPLYVYSSLFQNPQFGEIVIDRKQNLIELRLTRLETLPLVPYYFPQAAFREVAVNQSGDFSVTLTSPIKDLTAFEVIDRTSREARITPGRWQFRVMIGYGYDVSAVKLALASDAVGKEHPINEIVKWQKVAFSNSINIDVRK